MVGVGLMGGASFVNINYILLQSTDLDKREKELTITIN